MSDFKKTYAEAVSGKEREEEDGSPGESVILPSMKFFKYKVINKETEHSKLENNLKRSPRKRSGLLRMMKNLEEEHFEDWEEMEKPKSPLSEQQDSSPVQNRTPTKTIVISSDSESPSPKRLKTSNFDKGKRVVRRERTSPMQPNETLITSPISINSSPISINERDLIINNTGAQSVKRHLFDNDSDESADEMSIDYFMDDQTLPIFKRGLQTGIYTKTLVSEMVLGNPKMASRVPICVNVNALFIIDLERIGHHRDVLADGLGVWKQTSTKFHYFKLIKNVLQDINQERFGEENTFKVSRQSYRHSVSIDFHRIVVFITEHNGKKEFLFKKGAVQYFFEGNEHSVVAAPHGNSKQSNKPFQKTFESVKQTIKMKVENKDQPKTVVHSILEEKGGIKEIKAPGEHARNRQQISNFKYNLNHERYEDPLLELMDLCKLQSKNPSTAYVREVTASPELTVFLATDQQLIDVERFCCNSKDFSVLGVDATYNVGSYYLTLTTYRQLMLHTQKGKRPVCLGPAIIHQRRLFDSYFSLPSGMIKLHPNTQGLLVYGSDGEKNITDSFDACFVNSSHLLCDIHMKDNIKRKLTELGIKGEMAKLYENDIFGKQIGSEKHPGLVDCFSASAFDEKLGTLSKKWEESHVKGADFLSYFTTHKADLIKNCMTADLRSMCGLGYPPSMYDQNANECANSVIKRNINANKLGLKECVEHLEVIIKRQFEEHRLAMIGRGELRLDKKYQKLFIPEEKYYMMTAQQKDKHDKKFFQANVEAKETQSHDMTQKDQHSLSMSPEKSQIINVPFSIVQDMFDEAGKILSETGNVVLAPGSNERVHLVLNNNNIDTPHHVRMIGNKQFCCDKNCIRWVSYKICCHTLAVADYLTKLQQFLNWYNSTFRRPNYTPLANTDMPSNRGKKATKSTSRRKGGNPNKAKDYIEELLVDREENLSPGEGSSNRPSLPQPQSGEFILTLLKWCHENTSSCYGCKAKFKANGYPTPPSDFVVVSRGLRKYTTPNGTQHSKLGNVYFHLNNSCISEQNSFFYRSLLKIPNDVKKTLSDTHVEFLQKNKIDM